MKTKLKKPVMVRVGALRPHPKNDFKDIVGERWDAFLKAIKLDGVLHPIYINQKYEVLSGAQRVRACRSLGIKTIQAVVLPPMTPQEERFFIIDMNMGRGLSGEDLSKYLLERYAKEFEVLVDNHGNSGGRGPKVEEKRSALKTITSSGVVSSNKVKYMVRMKANERLRQGKNQALELLSASVKREVTAAETRCVSFAEKAREACDMHNANLDIINKHIKRGVSGIRRLKIQQSPDGKLYTAPI